VNVSTSLPSYLSEGIAKSLYSSKNRLGCKERSTIVLFELKHSFIILCVLYQILHFLFVATPASQGKAVVYCLMCCSAVASIYTKHPDKLTMQNNSTPSLCLLHRQQGLIGTGSTYRHIRNWWHQTSRPTSLMPHSTTG